MTIKGGSWRECVAMGLMVGVIICSVLLLGFFFIGIVLHCLVGGLWDCCVMLLDAWVGGRVFDG